MNDVFGMEILEALEDRQKCVYELFFLIKLFVDHFYPSGCLSVHRGYTFFVQNTCG